MKKLISIIVMMTLVMSMAACGGSSEPKPAGNTGTTSVQNVLDQQMKDAETAQDAEETEALEAETFAELPETDPVPENSEILSENSEYDVDLTQLSSTMVYSEVLNMMTEPDRYIGKTVRMNGMFSIYQGLDDNGDPDPDLIYYACVIPDATACCSQGLEFVLDGDYRYPEDYPELGDVIWVTGTFETYMEGEYKYCHLVNATMA